MPVAGYRIPDAAVNMRETSSMRTSACGTRISVLTFRATRNSPAGKRLTSLPPHLIVLPPNDPTLPIPPSSPNFPTPPSHPSPSPSRE